MQRRQIAQKYFSIPDVAILMLIATIIYGILSIGQQWRSEFHPVTEIDLSIWALPYYTLLSATRGIVAYLISLIFTLVIGYTAANSKTAEKILIPFLDILQSIPVLGFLPGLLLGLVALFPNTNTGLELAAILMIFTGQVWNMTFSFYASLKALPSDFREASTVIGLSKWERLTQIELPFSAVNLAWNSLLSMAGGWFFLIPCEAMTLGDREYRLPGIGSYMDVAVKQGDTTAIAMAIFAMITLIITMDFVIWRPVLSWVQRFRLEDVPGMGPTEPLMKIWFRESKLIRFFHVILRRSLVSHRTAKEIEKKLMHLRTFKAARSPKGVHATLRSPVFSKLVQVSLFILLAIFLTWGASKLVRTLVHIPPATWLVLIRNSVWTLLRVIFALTISTLWALPVGIWISTSPARIRIAQPIIQVLASFPAPMLYPLALTVFFTLGLSFDWSAMLLMCIGVQWYVLFNVLAGAMRIPQELSNALSLMKSSRMDRWKKLYLPSVFPSLVTGWVTAAGGAWNASIVAEYVVYKGTILKASGLGSALTVATESEDLTMFAASLTLMVCIVLLLNRLFWSRIQSLAQTRYRLEV